MSARVFFEHPLRVVVWALDRGLSAAQTLEDPIKNSLHYYLFAKLLPFPNLPMLIYEMQLQKVTIKILLFYLIKNKSHFDSRCVL